MTDLPEPFVGDTPMRVFQRWMQEARASEPNDPNAMALATVDETGMPNVRIVLLKEVEDDSFVFYTNYDSAKGHELATTRKAAFVLHWKSLRRQIRVRGQVTREDGPQADAYFASRDPVSRLGAWASHQSRPIASRAELIERVERAREAHGDDPPRPDHWGGFRIVPSEIEFWADGDHRLHDRLRWRRPSPDGSWSAQRLSP